MNRRDNEELQNIPRMTPAQDEVAGRRSQTGKRAAARPAASKRGPGGNGASGGLMATLALLMAIAAIGAAYFLWEQSRQTNQTAKNVEQRLLALESQLASTGDELSQSDAAVRIQLKDVDSEVRKLWDARKKTLQQVSQHDKNIKNLTTRTGTMQKSQTANAQQLTALAAELDEVVVMLESANFTTMQKTVTANQQKLQQLAKSLDVLNSRVAANEEWLESVNAFRRQVNDRLNEIQNPASSNAQPTLR
ncbi:MAG: hypothetical protein KJO24_00650 [Gammaproteobacteria bacterium]|nr:hypothetical protein [Gammaproteobacteria bacterium]